MKGNGQIWFETLDFFFKPWALRHDFFERVEFQDVKKTSTPETGAFGKRIYHGKFPESWTGLFKAEKLNTLAVQSSGHILELSLHHDIDTCILSMTGIR